MTTTSSTAEADLARHLLSRQHLGRTVVVCDKPLIEISVIRKYWLRLARQLQKERASTLNVEKILQLTHDITHMQHMEFAARPCAENPRADVFFVTPEQLQQLPLNCYNLYILSAPPAAELARAIAQLPDRSLVIDYSHDPSMQQAPLLAKHQLERQLPETWRKVEAFCMAHGVQLRALVDQPHSPQAVDEALDILLGISSQFMRIADDFLELLRLAQPLGTSNTDQHLYDLLTLLNRRICALTPGTLSQQFMQELNRDDWPGAHDVGTEQWAVALAV